MILFAAGAVVGAPLTQAAIDNDPDNDSVAIIRGGVFSGSALRTKAQQGDVPRVYNAFGIAHSELNGFVDGVVWKDGRVTLGSNGQGKLVARDAITAGRWDNPKPGMTRIPNTDRAYKMSTSHFTDEGQTAFIKMVNGRFDFAIIKPCGNPVTATPVAPPNQPPGLEMQKDVASMKANNWQQTITVKPGEHVRFRVTAKNTGKVVLDKLSFQDIMPQGLKHEPGVELLALNETFLMNDIAKGMTLPALKPGEKHTILIEATTSATEKRQSACTTGLANKAIVRSGDVLPDKSDTAVVKVCAPPVQNPDYQCVSLSQQLVDSTARKVRFTAKHTVTNGATFKHYVYDFGDGSDKLTSTQNTVEHTYARTGNYTAKVQVVVTVDGQERTVTSSACEQAISFTAPPTPPQPPAQDTPKKLVDTGTGALFGAVLSSIIGGVVSYRYIWLRKFTG